MHLGLHMPSCVVLRHETDIDAGGMGCCPFEIFYTTETLRRLTAQPAWRALAQALCEVLLAASKPTPKHKNRRYRLRDAAVFSLLMMRLT